MTADIADIAATRHRLWANGYRPLDLYSAVLGDPETGKKPFGEGWQHGARKNPPAVLQRSVETHLANTGILADGLRPIDVDVDDHRLAAQVTNMAVEMLGPTIHRYRDRSARCLLLYRAEGDDPSQIRKKTRKGPNGQVEVLGYGNQFVAYGQHYQHGADLQWATVGPDEVLATHLPVVTEEAIERFLEAVQALLGPAPAKPNGADHGPPRPPGPRPPAGSDMQRRLDGMRASLMGSISGLQDGGKHEGLLAKAITLGGYQEDGGWTDDDLIEDAVGRLRGKVNSWRGARDTVRDGLAYGREKPLVLEDRPREHKTNGANGAIPEGQWPPDPPESETEPKTETKQAPAAKKPPQPDKAVLRLYYGNENLVAEPLGTVVEGLIYRGSITLVYGAPKSGKSFLFTDLALSIAAGNADWMGHKITQPSPVLVVACEGHAGYYKRSRAAAKQRGWADMPAGYVVAKGRPALIRAEARGLSFAPDASAIFAALAEMKANGQNPVLIMIDTVFRSFGAGNVNASPDMNVYLQAIAQLTDAGYAVALVHHEVKSGGTPAGSVSLLGGADVITHVWKLEDGRRRWCVEEAKDDSETDPRGFALKVMAVDQDAEGRPVSSCAIEDEGAAPGSEEATKRGRRRDPTSKAGEMAELVFRELCNLCSDPIGCDMHNFHPQSVPIRSVTRTRLRGAINASGALGTLPDGPERKRVASRQDDEVKRAINRLKLDHRIAADERWVGLPKDGVQ